MAVSISRFHNPPTFTQKTAISAILHERGKVDALNTPVRSFRIATNSTSTFYVVIAVAHHSIQLDRLIVNM
jgi:hypothetical protein